MRTLVIDASTSTLFMGVMEGSSWLKLVKKDSGALEGLFDLAQEIFKDFPLESFQKIAFCHGPGRLMSLRVAAVAANQWAGATRERWVYNSLEFVSLATGQPAATELRSGTFALWQGGKTEITNTLPTGTTFINKSFPYPTDTFPTHAHKLLRRVEFFDAPMFAESTYVKATNKVVSKEN